MGKGEIEALARKTGALVTSDLHGPHGVVKYPGKAEFTSKQFDEFCRALLDTLAAEVESLKTDAERYRKVRRDPAMLLHLRNTAFDSAIDALPPEPQGVDGE